MALPLDHIRILDLSRLLPGPFATMLLADLGAEVIKVEEPLLGDYSRHYHVKFGEIGAGFAMLNRNKKSITLNLKHPRGPEIMKSLAKDADVLIESFRPGVMDRLGAGYSVLSKVNPGLIYCAITGYGQSGPYRDKPGHDLNYMGYSGAASLTGRRGGDHMPLGVQVADIGGGSLMAAFSILAAIIARQHTGRGQFIDVAMTEGVLTWLTTAFASLAACSSEPGRAGEMRLNGGQINYNIYPTLDGRFVALGALEEKFWDNFCRIVNRPDLRGKAFVIGEERERLEEELRSIFRQRSRDDWVKLLEDKDICFGPVYNIEEALEDPHLKARGVFVGVPAQGCGKVIGVAHPVKYSDTPAITRGADIEPKPAPQLGEHNDEIYSEIGLDVKSLREEGII